MRMRKMETASVTQQGGAGLERACGELGSVAFGLTHAVSSGSTEAQPGRPDGLVIPR